MSEKIDRQKEFCCECQGDMCETLPTEESKFVLIDRCGCVFEKTHLEGQIIRLQLADNILRYLDGKTISFNQFQCKNPTNVISQTFSMDCVIVNDRCKELYEGATTKWTDKKLTEHTNEQHRWYALAPNDLTKTWKEIVKEQRQGKAVLKNKSWNIFKEEIQKERQKKGEERDDNRIHQMEILEWAQLRYWDAQVKGCLKGDRVPAYGQEKWGIFTKMVFGVRCVYHVAVGLILNYGAWFAAWGNFIENETYKDFRSEHVGKRLAELFLQYYGMSYDYGRPRTLENRIWEKVFGKRPEPN